MERFESQRQFEDAEGSEPQEEPESERTLEDDFDARQEHVEKKSERTQQEVERENEVAHEHVSEALWKRPVRFVEDVISDKLVPYLRKFLKKFGSVEDDALATQEMRDVRDQAKEAAEDEVK